MDEKDWREIFEAFVTARDLPADERRTYAETAVTNPELRDELLALLARDDDPQVNGGSLFTSPGAAKADATPPLEWPRVGQTFGRFIVSAPLGRGGMGEVYRARDIELNRTVALKFLSAGDPGTPEDLSRFYREAHAASALNDPGIVTVYDIVRDGSAVGIVIWS